MRKWARDIQILTNTKPDTFNLENYTLFEYFSSISYEKWQRAYNPEE